MNVGDVMLDPSADVLHIVCSVKTDGFLATAMKAKALRDRCSLPRAERDELTLPLERHDFEAITFWKKASDEQTTLARVTVFGDTTVMIMPLVADVESA